MPISLASSLSTYAYAGLTLTLGIVHGCIHAAGPHRSRRSRRVLWKQQPDSHVQYQRDDTRTQGATCVWLSVLGIIPQCLARVLRLLEKLPQLTNMETLQVFSLDFHFQRKTNQIWGNYNINIYFLNMPLKGIYRQEHEAKIMVEHKCRKGPNTAKHLLLGTPLTFNYLSCVVAVSRKSKGLVSCPNLSFR